ncbi:heterokaryon incompatibility protein-domain-containing protein [Boeremia exigua]|uniref:heterokaryon incompatibility protein-domain-containing protein n=1 Tax=Boeremia exigua TaxID=749465 RepID=UPI001E8C9D5E|nr:heterokaryon incompatibility protein-domain-containing protein [Boeremia exigua]KAH6642262.1 heterokaryon incompatibility protein-domain-containing protein [Boeremia exigua]
MSESSAFVIPWANDTLCATCREVLRRPVSVTYGEMTLRISAARKCGLCLFFFDEIFSKTLRSSAKPADLALEKEGSLLRVTDFNDVLHLYELHTAQRQSVLSTTPFRLIQAHVNTEPCWKLIGKWLMGCEENHETCRQINLAAKPTRLLDIGSFPELRIVEHPTIDVNKRYAALSHCWGAAGIPLKLTKAVLDHFLHRIDLQAMSQNLQDAIFATRKLSIRYLWVDSLCIIQDSTEDWAAEAAQMGNYYRNAFVVLSSLSAADARTGFLRPRPYRASIRLGSGLQIRPARPSWEEVFKNSSLSTRAWAFQERLLSTRIVHFEHNELFWECLETSAREGSFLESSGLWTETDWRQESLKRCLAFDNIISSNKKPNKLTQEVLMLQWYRILAYYTTMEISYSADLGVAISGIAQKFGEATQFSYLAGIWLEDVHAGLLWYPIDSNQRKTSLTPTWSWVATYGPKKQIYDLDSRASDSQHEATIAGSSVVAPSSNNFIISSSSDSVCIELVASYFTPNCISNSNASHDYGTPYLRQVLEIVNDLGAFIGTGYLDTLDEIVDDTSSTDWTAIIICQRVHPKLGFVTYFLIVQPIREGVYRRVGIGQTADTVYGYATNTLDLESLQRKRFRLE